MPRASRTLFRGIQYAPVASSATLVTRQASSQSARRCRLAVNVSKDCTRRRVPIGRHGDEMGRRAAVNPRRIGIDALQDIRRRTRLAPVAMGLVGHGGPPCGVPHPGTGSRLSEQTPKRDHTLQRVTTEQAVTPRATLLDGHPAPVSLRPRFPDAARSYVGPSTSDRITRSFWSDEARQRRVGRYWASNLAGNVAP